MSDDSNNAGDLTTTSSTQNYVCVTPKNMESHMITKHDWKAVKKGVQKLSLQRKWWESFSWKDLGMVLLGAGITTRIALLLPGTRECSSNCVTSFL